MTTAQSRKAKGRNLQKKVVAAVLNKFTKLTAKDVRSCSMGNSGVDVQLSEAASKVFPWAVEAKNQEVHAAFIKAWEQATANTDPKTKPLLVLHANRLPTLAVLLFQDFMDIL